MRITRALLTLVLLTSSAAADVPDPAVESCRGKDVGDACSGGGCVKTTCSRARPGPNGMETSTWECMRCDPNAAVHGDNVRLAVGIGLAVVLLGGGVFLARRRMKRGTTA